MGMASAGSRPLRDLDHVEKKKNFEQFQPASHKHRPADPASPPRRKQGCPWPSVLPRYQATVGET